MGRIKKYIKHLQELESSATSGGWYAYGDVIAAMTGPGDCGGCSGVVGGPRHEPACEWSEIAWAGESDAEFIAAARRVVPSFIRLAEITLEQHNPLRSGFDTDWCKGCGAVWPCPPIRELEEVVPFDQI